jgi:hypothetical protein
MLGSITPNRSILGTASRVTSFAGDHTAVPNPIANLNAKVLRKPFKQEDLLRQVREALESEKLRKPG